MDARKQLRTAHGMLAAIGMEAFAERARRELESANILTPSGQAVPVTASLGVAELRKGESIDTLIDRADRAMYEAKSGGRNRVMRAVEPGEDLSTENWHQLS